MGDQAPLSFKMLEKEILHYKRTVYTLCLEFPTHTAIRNKFHKICANSKSLYIPGVGNFAGGDFLVHEQNIDPIIKFTAKQDIKLAGWIRATEDDAENDLTEEERKFSTADTDFEVNWENVVPHEQKKMIVTPLKYCSFDIECYSKNHNSKLPDPEIPENIIFQIIMIFGCFGYSENKMKMILLTLYDPKDIDGAETRRYKSEKSLLLDFSKLISSEDPDLFTGFNIIKFDWNYLIIRAKHCGIYPQFSKISRLVGQPAVMKTARWSSSAYGQQEFLYLDCHGRTNMDVLPEIERNFRLPTYSLKAVSEYFLQDSKEDISARQLFMSVKLTQEIGPLVEKKVNIFQLKKIKRRIEEIFPERQTHGVMKKLRRDLLDSTPNNIQRLVKKAIWVCGVYCKKDGILPIKLAEKLNLRTTMDELANVMNVPSTYMHTRGQQIKVIAQLYRETMANNIIIPFKGYTDEIEKYQGAVVFKAVPGDYEDVACLDFASLYPSIMIAYNICYTTLLKDDDPTPDSECHVIEFEDHIKCEHDPQKRKPKKSGEDILCKCHRYRFRKMKIVIDKDGSVEYQNEGIMPRLERRLLSERKVYKKELFKAQTRLALHEGNAEEDAVKYYESQGWEMIDKGSLSKKDVEILAVTIAVLDAKQKALKVSANSMYGGMGAQKGYIPLVPGAASITAMGRKLIMLAVERIQKEFSCAILTYGDSVTGDTPVLCMKDGVIHILPIEELKLLSDGEWTEYPLFKLDGSDRRDKEKIDIRGQDELKVWCGEPHGWQALRKIIRHKVEKDIFRVATRNGVIDVTEDHSLLSPSGKKLRAGDVNAGDSLMTSFPRQFEYSQNAQKGAKISFKKQRSSREGWNDETDEYHEVRERRTPGRERRRKKTSQKGARDPEYISENNYIYNYENKEISAEETWVWGFFMAHGSCGRYETKSGIKHSWAINNKNLDRLAKAKDILEAVEPFKFEILDAEQPSGAHRLVPQGYLSYIAEKYLRFMYLGGKKYIRAEVLNADLDRRKMFFDGYYCGDGREPSRDLRFGAEGKLAAQCLYYLAKSIGHKNLRITERKNRPDFYTMSETKGGGDAPGNKVKEMRKIKTDTDLVYDLETACGRFQGGLGEIIASNTDSCMMMYKGKSRKEAFALAKESSKLATHCIKCQIVGVDEEYCLTLKDTKEKVRLDRVRKDEHFDRLSRKDKIKFLEYQLTPIDLEFENMYGRFFLLTKKRYIAYVMNIDGKITNVVKKGVVLARRDNCEYLRNTYKKAATAILDKKSEEEVMNIIYDRVHALFTQQIQDTQLIIYMGVKKITDYAKSKEVKDVRGRVLDKVHIDMYGDPIDSKENTLDPLDPRLMYPNLPQVLLAKKMMERGDDVPANTRLEFLYLQTKDTLHQGDKAEDYTYYKENKDIENLRPDNLHYLEKQLSKPITELLTVKYPREPVPYEKLDDARLRCIREIHDELISQRIARTRVITKERPTPGSILDSDSNPVLVGWDALLPDTEKEWSAKRMIKLSDERGCVRRIKGLLKNKGPIRWGGVRGRFIKEEKKQISDMKRAWNGTSEPFPEYFEQYKFKGNMAKVEYILRSARTPGKTEINPNKYAELVDVCKKWKSRAILNEHYKRFGLRIRPTKHPSRSGEELPVLYPVMLTRNIGEYEKGTLCQVYATYVKEKRATKRSAIVLRCDYDILMKDGKVIKDLLRRDITTYLYRDSAIMKDILDARTYYNEVINSLNEKNNAPFVNFKDIDTVSDSTYCSD